MKKIIRKREYDTERAVLVKRYVCGLYGDPAGYEELLFQTPDGYYFLYGRGGDQSPYPEEDMKILAKTKVKDWLDTH